ncbi:MAG: thioesterase family protein, partial [Parvularculaceae bacterium]
MKFSELMASLRASGGAFETAITDNWLQGRTTYGGLSAALCLEATLRAFPDLPPLRSAQISFLGPVGGTVRIKPEALRRGRNVSFVNADLIGESGGIATRAVFAFGQTRETELAADFAPAREFPPPDRLPAPRREGSPGFALEFDVRWLTGGKPFSGSRDCDVFLWAWHGDVAARSAPALLALADMPPPALFPMFPRFGP